MKKSKKQTDRISVYEKYKKHIGKLSGAGCRYECADYRKYAENEKLSDSRRKLMNYFADWEIFRIFAPILTDHIMSNLLKKIN